ncbi:MAG: hypothetical protein K2K29_01480 [Muribaculaceae bacterium]|nr:hypothetical protein [Muribaculaceae bacterium]
MLDEMLGGGFNPLAFAPADDEDMPATQCYPADEDDPEFPVEGDVKQIKIMAAALHPVTGELMKTPVVANVTTAVEAIEAAEGEVVYYDLQGVRVENPSNGIYIMIKNGKALKVSVK